MPFVAFFITLICFSANAQAGTANEADQQQLQQTLKKLEQSTEERERQRLRVEKLNRQLKCNLELINAYKDCDARYKDSPKEHLDCVQAVKRRLENCSIPYEK